VVPPKRFSQWDTVIISTAGMMNFYRTGPVWHPTENLGSKPGKTEGKRTAFRNKLPQSKTEVDGREETERRWPLRPGGCKKVT